jgi:hypothetical protein
MKFWELISYCRSEPALLDLVADNPEWAEFARWIQDRDRLVEQQDREKLDVELPDDLCRHVLSQSSAAYKISEGWVRSSGSSVPGDPISALEVFNRYGGSFLEEVNEYGSCRIPSS